MPKHKFYAVYAGRRKGVFLSWDYCQKQVSGFPNASFKKFSNRSDAEKFAFGLAATSGTGRAPEDAIRRGRQPREPRAPGAPRAPRDGRRRASSTSRSASAKKRAVSEAISFPEGEADTFVMQFDGASRGNPGLAGGGAHLMDSDRNELGRAIARWPHGLDRVMHDGHFDGAKDVPGAGMGTGTALWLQARRRGKGLGTSNQGEYLGLLAGLCLARDLLAVPLLAGRRGLTTAQARAAFVRGVGDAEGGEDDGVGVGGGGAARGGAGGAGVAATSSSSSSSSSSPSVPSSSSSPSSALPRGLSHTRARLVLLGDSQLIVRQLRGSYSVKSDSILVLHKRALQLLDRLWSAGVHCDPSSDIGHVPRAHNAVADALANEAVDLPEGEHFKEVLVGNRGQTGGGASGAGGEDSLR